MASHVTEVAGPTQALVSYLQERADELAIALHPFAYTTLAGSTFERWRSGKLIARRQARWPRVLSLLRDVTANLYWFGTSGPYELFLGVDNLNAFCGIVLRALGRARTVVYYVIDYTPRRFSNPLLNRLYHWVDRFAVRHADQVWNISARIAEVRRRQGLPETRNHVVGVGVDLGAVGSAEQRRMHDLVLVSHLTEDKGVQLAIQAMPLIRKRVADSRLLIIGTGPYAAELGRLAQAAQLGDAVRFLGPMTRQQLFAFLPACGVALAPYVESAASITYYADPTKPKEYLACGLPVVITPVPWIAEAIATHPMGACVPYDAEALADAVVRLMSDGELYARCRANARRFTENLSWEKIYNDAFAALGLAAEDVDFGGARGGK